MMTPEILREVLPKTLALNATQEFADQINRLVLEPEVAEDVRQNFMTYSKVLTEGRFKTEDYLYAVLYATHKFMGYTNKEAYVRTFPDRYQSLVARGISGKDISAHISAYSKNKLVNLILEQALIPVHVLYQDAFHKAMATQIELMTDVNQSGKVRGDSANSVLTHTRAPDVKKVQMDFGVTESAGLAELREAMRGLAHGQVAAIRNKEASPGAVAAQRIVLTSAEKASAVDAEELPVVVSPPPTPIPVPASIPVQGGSMRSLFDFQPETVE